MNRFAARANVRHFCTKLRMESDARTRKRLHEMLLQEESKLGRDHEQLSWIEGEIGALREQMANEKSRADRGDDGAAFAKTMLGMLENTLGLYQSYRGIVVTSIRRNGLWDR